MTTNKAQKEAVRFRMEITGENYTTAKRNIETHPIVVWELGEDSDSWFVQNTINKEVALKAIHAWFEECTGVWSKTANGEWVSEPKKLEPVSDLSYSLETINELTNSTPVVKEDWFWSPIQEEYPDDEAMLVSKSKEPDLYKGEALMSGIHFRL